MVSRNVKYMKFTGIEEYSRLWENVPQIIVSATEDHMIDIHVEALSSSLRHVCVSSCLQSHSCPICLTRR